MHLGSFCTFLGSSLHLTGKGLFTNGHNKPSHSYTLLFTHHLVNNKCKSEYHCLNFLALSASTQSTTIFAIRLRKCDNGYSNSVVNAGKHPTEMEKNYGFLFILSFQPQNHRTKSIILRKL